RERLLRGAYWTSSPRIIRRVLPVCGCSIGDIVVWRKWILRNETVTVLPLIHCQTIWNQRNRLRHRENNPVNSKSSGGQIDGCLATLIGTRQLLQLQSIRPFFHRSNPIATVDIGYPAPDNLMVGIDSNKMNPRGGASG